MFSQLLGVNNQVSSSCRTVLDTWKDNILMLRTQISVFFVQMRKKTKLYYFEEFVSYYNQQKFSNVTKSVILDLDSK